MVIIINIIIIVTLTVSVIMSRH